jgi:hypothetical protein
MSQIPLVMGHGPVEFQDNSRIPRGLEQSPVAPSGGFRAIPQPQPTPALVEASLENGVMVHRVIKPAGMGDVIPDDLKMPMSKAAANRLILPEVYGDKRPEPATQQGFIPAPVAAQASLPPITLMLDFGHGEQEATYSAIIKEKQSLILAVKAGSPAAPFWPKATSDAKFAVQVKGQPEIDLVTPTGIRFSNDGWDYCVLAILQRTT